jgi:hypothetical protein
MTCKRSTSIHENFHLTLSHSNLDTKRLWSAASRLGTMDSSGHGLTHVVSTRPAVRSCPRQSIQCFNGTVTVRYVTHSSPMYLMEIFSIMSTPNFETVDGLQEDGLYKSYLLRPICGFSVDRGIFLGIDVTCVT